MSEPSVPATSEEPRRRHTISIVLTMILAGVLIAAACGRAPRTEGRPAQWAQPVSNLALPNLHQIAPGLYRGAQPAAAGMRELEQMGVRTVLNLRGFHDDDEEVAGTTLTCRHISFKTWHPEDEDVIEFLRLVQAPTNRPLFFHCQHGADRTGLMCAIYRVAVDSWTKDEAIREMTEGGYGWHPVWGNLIDYLQRLDIEALRRRAAAR